MPTPTERKKVLAANRNLRKAAKKKLGDKDKVAKFMNVHPRRKRILED
jgi:hypothetical protein